MAARRTRKVARALTPAERAWAEMYGAWRERARSRGRFNARPRIANVSSTSVPAEVYRELGFGPEEVPAITWAPRQLGVEYQGWWPGARLVGAGAQVTVELLAATRDGEGAAAVWISAFLFECMRDRDFAMGAAVAHRQGEYLRPHRLLGEVVLPVLEAKVPHERWHGQMRKPFPGGHGGPYPDDPRWRSLAGVAEMALDVARVTASRWRVLRFIDHAEQQERMMARAMEAMRALERRVGLGDWLAGGRRRTR